MIKTIAVLGAGTMGHTIALSFAMYGYDVNLYDTSAQVLDKALENIASGLNFLVEEHYLAADKVASALARVHTFSDLAAAVAGRDYVIEAVPEILVLKQELFTQLDSLCDPHTILASNTSSLKLADMMALLPEERKKRTLVNHWYNPGHLMPIVEMSFFGNMPEETYREVEALYASIRKQTVKVLKDVPGLVANRIQQGVAREVFSIIEQGIAAPEDVDKALKFGPAFRYATTGQLEVADFGGLDIWCVVGDNLLKVIDNSQEANPLLRAKVSQGKLGLKTGEGFFVYPPDKVDAVKKNFMRKLVVQLKASENYV